MKLRDRGSVLVVGPAWVGDMIIAQSLFKTLRANDPGTAIDVIAPPWSLPLLDRMPEVRRGIALPVAHGELALRQRWRLGRGLRNEGYAQGIVLPRSAKAALPLLAARIPRRTGYRGEFRFVLLNDIRPLDRGRLYRTVDRFVNLGLPADAPMLDVVPEPRLRIDGTGARQTAAALGLDPGAGPVLALCPGAEYGSAKRWPEEHYARVARDRLDAGWQVWLFGSARDQAVAAVIGALAPGAVDLAGRTSLAQAVDLLSLAHAVVSNDSGLMHVAAAAGVPVIAIFGSSDPNYTPPLSARARILSLGLDCSPCFRRECPLGHLNCLRQLPPEQVTALLCGGTFPD